MKIHYHNPNPALDKVVHVHTPTQNTQSRRQRGQYTSQLPPVPGPSSTTAMANAGGRRNKSARIHSISGLNPNYRPDDPYTRVKPTSIVGPSSGVSSALHTVEDPTIPREEKEYILRRLDGLIGHRAEHPPVRSQPEHSHTHHAYAICDPSNSHRQISYSRNGGAPTGTTIRKGAPDYGRGARGRQMHAFAPSQQSRSHVAATPTSSLTSMRASERRVVPDTSSTRSTAGGSFASGREHLLDIPEDRVSQYSSANAHSSNSKMLPKDVRFSDGSRPVIRV